MRDPVLIGAEQVERAASRMASAADQMNRAASAMEDAARRLEAALVQFGADGASLVHRLEELQLRQLRHSVNKE